MEEESSSENSHVMQKEVTAEDWTTLQEALYEVCNDMGVEGLSLDKSSSHGFSMDLIEDITSNCETIFTVQDLICNFPVFSISSSLRILEVIQEVFMDIRNLEETFSFMNLHSVPELPNRNSRVHEWFDFNEMDLNESDNDSVPLEI